MGTLPLREPPQDPNMSIENQPNPVPSEPQQDGCVIGDEHLCGWYKDCCACLQAMCCPCYSLAQLHESTGQNGGLQGYMPIVIISWLSFIAYMICSQIGHGAEVAGDASGASANLVLGYIFEAIFNPYLLWLAFTSRQTIANAYMVETSCCMNCCCVFFCLPCSLAQLHRVLKVHSNEGCFAKPETLDMFRA